MMQFKMGSQEKSTQSIINLITHQTKQLKNRRYQRNNRDISSNESVSMISNQNSFMRNSTSIQKSYCKTPNSSGISQNCAEKNTNTMQISSKNNSTINGKKKGGDKSIIKVSENNIKTKNKNENNNAAFKNNEVLNESTINTLNTSLNNSQFIEEGFPKVLQDIEKSVGNLKKYYSHVCKKKKFK